MGLRSGLTEKQRDVLNRKLKYVLGVTKNCDRPCSQRVISEVVQKIALELGDNNAPGASTVAGWIKRWRAGNREDAALMPEIKPTRINPNRIHVDVYNIIVEAIQTAYLNRQRNNQRAVLAEVQIRIAEANEQRDTPLVVPSRETIRKIVNSIDLFQRDKARHGVMYAQRRHRATGKGFVTAEVLELAMADGQIMDLILVDANGKEIGRPFITAIIDVHSRCILSAFISLAPFSGATLLKAMSAAVVASPGLPKGIMSKIIVDNGSDYRHSGFVRFCNALDITIEPCPPRMPNGKAMIERFFRTMNEDLIHKLPGTTFSNPTVRGDYQSQQWARTTLEDLRKHVDNWIHEIYHTTPHRSLSRAPIDVWNEETSS